MAKKNWARFSKMLGFYNYQYKNKKTDPLGLNVNIPLKEIVKSTIRILTNDKNFDVDKFLKDIRKEEEYQEEYKKWRKNK